MRRTMLGLLLLTLCSSAFAMEVFPPAPDSHTFIKLLTQNSPFCSLQRTDVALEGSTITVTAIPTSAVCPAILFPLRADVGVVPGGVYDVIFRGPTGTEFDRTKLIVRDASSGIIVSPVGGRLQAPRTVQVFGAAANSTVLFDGVPATDPHVVNGVLVVTPPAHAAGTVDVTVNDESGNSRRAAAAFTYFDPSAAPDPFVFEPLLYPVAYDGPGIFGSQWVTNNVMATGNTLVRFRDLVEARTCSSTCSQFNWSAVLAPESQSGVLLWAIRRRFPLGTEDDFHVSSRIVDTSQPHGNGTGLPVAREGDFHSSFTIEDVPVGGAARGTLRIYSPVDVEQIVQVSVNVANAQTTTQTVTLKPVNGVAFAAVDLSGAADSRTAPARIVVNGVSAKVWGLVSVTDNATQEVTAFWPQ
jgi:hypothetical protein